MMNTGIDHRHLDEHRFAIINPLQVDRSQWAGLPVAALMPAGVSAKPDSVPHLLALDALGESDRIDLLVRADVWDRVNDHPFFSMLLRSQADASRLALHLSRQLTVTIPEGGRALLRWYDPRVLRHLRWLITPAQWRVLGGPVTAWTWRDAQRQWHTHESTGEPAPISSLRPTAGQWAVIGRLGVLNRTLAQLRRNAPGLVLDDAACQRIDGLLRQAFDDLGLTDEADARLFAEQGMRYHRDVYRHPAIEQRLALARDQQVTYVGACADLDPTTLSGWKPEPDLQRKESCT